MELQASAKKATTLLAGATLTVERIYLLIMVFTCA